MPAEGASGRWTPEPRLRRLIFLAVLAASAVYVLTLVDRGWVPHDEGTLAQPAARVLLRGELPHRDFDAMYTGGQALYHAGVFAVLGVNLLSLRIALFGAFVLTLPLFWYAATRLAGPVAAAVTVVLAVAWAIPNYPAAMPSWYNLFLAVGAVAAVLRYLEVERRRWLAAAGVCAGLSIVVKVVGLYLVAALLLFAVYREQEACVRAGSEGRREEEGAGRLHSVLVTAGLSAFLAGLVLLLHRLATPATLFHFFVPPAALAAWLAWREWRTVPAASGRTRRLTGLVAPVLVGIAAPVAAFLVPYVATGSVGDLLRGVFLLPAERFGMATRLPPGPLAAVPLAALAGVTAWATAAGRRAETVVAAVLGTGLLAVLVLADRPPVYRGAWWLLRPLVPVLVLAGVVRLAVDEGGGDERLVLLLAAAGMTSLVQFPTSAPVYLFYAAPLAALLGLALVASLPRPPWTVAGVTAGFHVAFAVLWLHTGWIYQMGERYAAHPPTEELALDRGGIRVVHEERVEMERLVALLQVVAPGPWIWATPDAPEVYFLAERKNPTRTLFDFFAEEEGRRQRILRMLEERNVGAVVFDTGPTRFSRFPSVDFQRAIAERYPRALRIGRFFVRWKGDRPAPESLGSAPGPAHFSSSSWSGSVRKRR